MSGGFNKTGGVERDRSVHGVPLSETPRRDLYANIGDGVDAVLCQFLDECGDPLPIDTWSLSADIRQEPMHDPQIVRCTPGNGRLVVDAGTAQVSMVLSPEDVKRITDTGAMYDLRAVIPQRANPVYPVRGDLHVQRRVTRP